MTERSWIFGQGADCDVQVQDEYVSTKHCKVTLHDDGSVTVEDLGSTNGTYVRPPNKVASLFDPGMRVRRPVEIEPGWIIRIGRTDIPWTVP